MEESSNAFFGLAAWQLDLWKTCVVVRTACAILAWILNSLRTALPLVTLPPAKTTTSPPMRRAALGTTPCQPINPKPRRLIGKNIIVTASLFVSALKRPAHIGMVA